MKLTKLTDILNKEIKLDGINNYINRAKQFINDHKPAIAGSSIAALAALALASKSESSPLEIDSLGTFFNDTLGYNAHVVHDSLEGYFLPDSTDSTGVLDLKNYECLLFNFSEQPDSNKTLYPVFIGALPCDSTADSLKLEEVMAQNNGVIYWINTANDTALTHENGEACRMDEAASGERHYNYQTDVPVDEHIPDGMQRGIEGFPNPVIDHITFYLPNGGHYSVRDVSGRVIDVIGAGKKGNHYEINFGTGDLAAGTYFLTGLGPAKCEPKKFLVVK